MRPLCGVVIVRAEARIGRNGGAFEGNALAFAEQRKYDQCSKDQNLRDNGNQYRAKFAAAGTAFLFWIAFDKTAIQ
jgi:hypothetical protein